MTTQLHSNLNRRHCLQWLVAGVAAAMLPAAWGDGVNQLMLLEGTDYSGKRITLSDFKGSIVLVSFFTSGCALCTRDLKLMREFYVSNAQRHFVLLAVNMDTDKHDVDTYNQVLAITVPKDQRFPMVWRNAPEHTDNFGAIVRQPTHFVIDREGNFVFKREGTFLADDWANLAQSLK